MEYYYLKEKIDSLETGRNFPAVQSIDNYDFKKVNSVYILNQSNFPQIVPDIKFILSNGANWCDVLSQGTISSSGILISEQFKMLLQNVGRKSPSRFYPAQIQKKSVSKTYYWWKIIDENRIARIDFAKTIFKYKVTKSDELNFQCQNEIEFKLKQKEPGFFNPLKTDKLYLKSDDYSIFLHPLNSRITINMETAKLLDNITGLEILSL